MAFRALALDVDGTLICSDQKKITPETTAVLKKLQSRGVIIILATGRSGFASTGAILGTDFIPDWRVCVNGAQIINADGCIVEEQRFELNDVEIITAFASQRAIPLTFTFEDAYYIYSSYDEYIDYYTSHAGPVPYLRDGSDHSRHMQSLPFGAYIIRMPGKQSAALAELCPSIKLMETYPDAYDVSPRSADKKHGVEWVISRLGIGFDELAAIGDSDNDRELMSAAGLSIAMANAPAHIRASADHVTGSVEENGVAAAIERFFGTG